MTKKPIILLVEDDGAISVRLHKMLQKWGYDAVIADSYVTALQSAAIHHPTLALMDIDPLIWAVGVRTALIPRWLCGHSSACRPST